MWHPCGDVWWIFGCAIANWNAAILVGFMGAMLCMLLAAANGFAKFGLTMGIAGYTLDKLASNG